MTADLGALVARYLDAAAPLAEWQLAWDHGALSSCEEDAFDAMKLAAAEALAAARAVWDAATPDAIATYDARVAAAAVVPELGARVAATRSPARTFDVEAIAAVLGTVTG